MGCTPQSLTPRWDAHRGVIKNFRSLDSPVWCTPRSFLKIQISLWNWNRIRKFSSLFIRGLDGFESWKKWMSKILWHTPFKNGQGWEFAHLIIHSFRSNQMSDYERFAQIAQDKWATVSESLRSLETNEWPWANPSGHSRQMSHCERFAQVAHDKWANEGFSQKFWAKKI